jgi:hypothetical protein
MEGSIHIVQEHFVLFIDYTGVCPFLTLLGFKALMVKAFGLIGVRSKETVLQDLREGGIKHWSQSKVVPFRIQTLNGFFLHHHLAKFRNRFSGSKYKNWAFLSQTRLLFIYKEFQAGRSVNIFSGIVSVALALPGGKLSIPQK